MAFGWAGAAAGAAESLEEILTRKLMEKQQADQLALQQQRMQQDATQFDASMGLQRDQLARLTASDQAEQTYRTGQAERQATQDRKQINLDEVRKMAVEGVRTGTAKPMDASLMALGEGVQIPETALDPEAPQRRLIELENLRSRNDIREIGARASQAPEGGEPLMSVIGPDGKAVYVPRSQAVGQQPASGREQGRPVISGDANRIADLDTSLNDLDTLETEIKGFTGTGSQIGAALPNFVTNATGIGVDSKQRQAVIDRVKQVIGKALEGGVLRKEDEYKYAKILPVIGDNPQVAASKIQGLRQAITQRRQTTLDALADAGYETSKYRERDTDDALLDELLRGGQ